jgi:hypothetical protein
MMDYVGYDLEPSLLLLPENSEEFKKLAPEVRAKIRLAKANLQIIKNTDDMKKEVGSLERIEVGPNRKASRVDLSSSGNFLMSE